MPADNADTAEVVSSGSTNREAQPEQSVEQPLPESTQEPSRSLDGVMDSLGLPPEVKEVLQSAQEPEATNEAAPEPEPEPEVPAEEEKPAEEEPEKESDEDEEPEEAAPENKGQWPPEAIKLKDKYRRQRNEARERAEAAEAKAAELESKLAETAPVVVAPTVQDPLSHVTTLAQLEAEKLEFRNLRDMARRNPDGWVVNANTDKEVVIDREKAAQYLSWAEDVLSESIPAKAKEIETRPQFTNHAKAIVPSMFESSHPDHQLGQVILKEFPALASHPKRDLFMAYALVGIRAEQAAAAVAAQKKNGTTAPDKKLQVPQELVNQHRNRDKVPVLRQNPPTRVNGNSPPSNGKASHNPVEDILTDQSSAALGRAMRQMRGDTSDKGSRRPVTV